MFLNFHLFFRADARAVEQACDELSNSSRLRQLLGIVLQFGNRLNTAGNKTKRVAGAFTLDSLLKLNQAKAFDKKTTFLHYLVLIVQRNNELLLKFADDLPTVLKADRIYWDQCLSDLEGVENQLENVRRIALHEARIQKQHQLSRRKSQDDDNESLGDIEMTLEEEVESLRATQMGMFTLSAIKQVSALRDKVDLTRNKFVKILEYFGEDANKMQPHDLFTIFSTFCRDFGKAKEEVFANVKKKLREERKNNRNQTPSGKNGKPIPSGKGGKQTPNGKSGKPPAGPDRSWKPMRASSHQPNLSRVIKDFQSQKSPDKIIQPGVQRFNGKPSEQQQQSRQDFSRGESYSTSASTQNRGGSVIQSPEPREQYARTQPDIPVTPPRGMQEAGRLQNVQVRTPPRSPADVLREKARSSRKMQVVSGRSTPVTSNTSLNRAPMSSPPNTYNAKKVGHPVKTPPAPVNTAVGALTSSSPPSASPRSSMTDTMRERHRRRLVARKNAGVIANN